MLEDKNIFIKCLFSLTSTALRNSKPLFRHLKARGVPVVLWVLNEEKEFMEAYEMYGDTVHGIMSDRPTTLIEFINKITKY